MKIGLQRKSLKLEKTYDLGTRNQNPFRNKKWFTLSFVRSFYHLKSDKEYRIHMNKFILWLLEPINHRFENHLIFVLKSSFNLHLRWSQYMELSQFFSINRLVFSFHCLIGQFSCVIYHVVKDMMLSKFVRMCKVLRNNVISH